jgi:hypothetical protein
MDITTIARDVAPQDFRVGGILFLEWGEGAEIRPVQEGFCVCIRNFFCIGRVGRITIRWIGNSSGNQLEMLS